MGPVSFESFDLGPDRTRVITIARRAKDAGLRFDLVDHTDPDGRRTTRMMVRTTDAAAARNLISGGDTADVASPTLAIAPLAAAPDVTVRVPGSKSHTNRALVCAALAEGTSTLDDVLVADDTEAMITALADLGLDVVFDRDVPRVVITGGSGRLPDGPRRVDARQSGTTSRFLLPMLTLGTGVYQLDGHEQMRARPFGDLLTALKTLGARVEGTMLPLTVHGSGVLKGGWLSVPGAVSSQFLSALLLSAPCADGPVDIVIDGPLVSRPYIDLTIATMTSFGASVDRFGDDRFLVAPTGYRAADVGIEPDASAASYFFAAAAITGGRVTVDGLGTETQQGDIGFVKLLADMGAEVDQTATSTTVRGTGTLRGVEVDMADISDTAQSLAVVAPFASSPTTVTGIGFIRKKETDRIAAVVTELRRLGVDAEEISDGFVIRPGPPTGGRVETYDDHRMAMSFAVLGLVVPGIELIDPDCVSKTFPDFFGVLDQLR